MNFLNILPLFSQKGLLQDSCRSYACVSQTCTSIMFCTYWLIAGYGRIRIFKNQEKDSRDQIVLREENLQIRSLVASLFLAYATNEVLYMPWDTRQLLPCCDLIVKILGLIYCLVQMQHTGSFSKKKNVWTTRHSVRFLTEKVYLELTKLIIQNNKSYREKLGSRSDVNIWCFQKQTKEHNSSNLNWNLQHQ